MNFSFYIFGTLGRQYSQYPDDYIASSLSNVPEETKGVRLIIQREMQLVHYIFTEKLSEENVIGFCLVFNNTRLLKPKNLILFFHELIEKHLIEVGEIVRYTDGGVLQNKISSFHEKQDVYEVLSALVNKELEENGSRYGIKVLNTIYDGTRTCESIETSASEDEIIALTEKHNKVIIDNHAGLTKSHIRQLLETLREENIKAHGKIEKLEANVKTLNRKKKQYSYVITLFIIVLGCCAGLYFLNDNLNTTKGDLIDTKKIVEVQNDSLNSKDAQISSLDKQRETEISKRELAEQNLVEIKENTEGIQPFMVKSTSFNFTTGYFSFRYYGFKEKEVNIKIYAFSENGEYYGNSSRIHIKEGNNQAAIYLSSYLSAQRWYHFEILIDNKIVGGDRH